GPGKLDETLVEGIVGAAPLGEPQLFEHVVRFVKQPPVEALEVAQVAGVQVTALAALDQRGNLPALLAHRKSLGPGGQNANRKFLCSLLRPSYSGCMARSDEHTSELQSRFDLVCR